MSVIEEEIKLVNANASTADININGTAPVFDDTALATRALWEIVKSKFDLSDSDLQDQMVKLLNPAPTETLPEPTENPFSAPAESDIVEPEDIIPEIDEVEPELQPEEVQTQVNESNSPEFELEGQAAEPATPPQEEIEFCNIDSTNLFKAIEVDDEETFKGSPEQPQLEIEPIEAKLRGDLVKCPGCGKVFSVLDDRLWDGEQHTPCATPLKIDGLESLHFKTRRRSSK